MTSPGFDSTKLPSLQPRTHCVLIARDPHVIYAYWDYTKHDIQGIFPKSKKDNKQLILRVYGQASNDILEIDIGSSVKNIYINVKDDNAEYFAEIGFKDNKKQFIPLVRSNSIRTPSKSAVKRDDLIWQNIQAYKESPPFIKEDLRGRYKRHQSYKRSHQEKKAHQGRTYHLSHQDIKAYYAKIFNKLSLKGKAESISWQKVKPFITAFDLLGKIHPAGSVGLLDRQGASENLLESKSPERKVALIHQGGGSEGRLNKRQFFFEVWTELIVHGRTEPDATVLLNQKNIKLNADGTFTLRYALPDGEIPLKFIAQSSDAVEQRHIYTRVEREKTIEFPKILKAPNA